MLFDWCGTLVAYPSIEDRLRLVRRALGRPDDEAEIDRLASAIGAAEQHADAIAADERCDLSAANHAAAKRVVHDLAGLDSELDEALERTYGDLRTYPDHPEAVGVLRALADAGIQIAIVSDFHVDLRPRFAELGILDLIAGFALSFEVGVTKPAAAMFEHAVAAVGVPPRRCLMVGDNPGPDGGAAALGIATLILPVDHSPTRRPMLDDVLSLALPRTHPS